MFFFFFFFFFCFFFLLLLSWNISNIHSGNMILIRTDKWTCANGTMKAFKSTAAVRKKTSFATAVSHVVQENQTERVERQNTKPLHIRKPRKGVSFSTSRSICEEAAENDEGDELLRWVIFILIFLWALRWFWWATKINVWIINGEI